MNELEVQAAAGRKARGVVLLGTLRARQHAWLWDGTEVQVVYQSSGSTLVTYLASKVRANISHRTEVRTNKPKEEAA